MLREAARHHELCPQCGGDFKIIAAIEEPAVIVKDEKPAPGAAIDVGLKPAVAPDGRPDVESETVALNPAETVVVIVEIPELP